MKYLANTITDILDKPGGTIIRTLTPGNEAFATGRTDTQFMELTFTDGGVGWGREADFVPEDPAERPAVDRVVYVEECLKIERLINELPTTSPWFVAADFIIARAFIETNLVNCGSKIPDSDAVGPLQVSSQEWQVFLANAGALAANYDANSYDHWLKQILGAAWRMYTHAKAMGALRPVAQADVGTGPFIPSYLDLFHAHILDSPEGAVAIRDADVAAQGLSDANAAQQARSRTIDSVLQGTPAALNFDELCKQRGQFLGTQNQPKSLGDFVTGSEKALNDALTNAFNLIKDLAPTELPQIKQGEAPWLDVAQQEEAANVAEPNPRIVSYFNATDIAPKPTSTNIPWCGAFAAFCMSQSGNGASIPKGSAAAASWKSWGNAISWQSDNVPEGAVVVLSPTAGTGGTGHVGFFVELSGDQIRLLGGNQSNKVTRTLFSKDRIAAVRWLDLAPITGPAAGGTDGPISSTQISQRAIDLIVQNEVSSQAAYQKLYHKPTWPKGQSGVTVGIGYDCGYTTSAQLAQDWSGQLPPAIITKLQTACEVKGASAGALASSLSDQGVDIPWAAAMAVFLKRDIPRWTGIVEGALANCNLLSPDSLGALVSLAYNRGASFSMPGDRYREMNNVRTDMANKSFADIPTQIRAMTRLWPTMAGLRTRRNQEAQLFQDGLAQGQG